MNTAKLTPLVARRIKRIEPVLRELAEVKRLGAEDIGPRVGVTPHTARRYLRLLGINFVTNGRKVFKLDTSGWAKDVPKMYAQGKSTQEIAELKGVCASSIYRWLANNGHITVRERCTR